MTIRDLRDIVKERGLGASWWWGYNIGGCKLLERIEDVEGFVELLCEFKRKGFSFVEDYDPILTILGGGVEFRVSTDNTWIRIDAKFYYYH